MSYKVTSSHPITLPGGRMFAPGDVVAKVKVSDPHVASLIEAGLLTKKAAPKPPPAAKKAEEAEAPAPVKNTTDEKETT